MASWLIVGANMKYLAVVLVLFASAAFAKERDRCPFETPQQVSARDAVDAKIGGYVDSSSVTADPASASFPIPAQADLDKKRMLLAQLEIWAMSLTDVQLKTDYICAIMTRRRGLDDAALEMVDHHNKIQLDAAKRARTVQSPPAVLAFPGVPAK
jgi:hypothetical protein